MRGVGYARVGYALGGSTVNEIVFLEHLAYDPHGQI